MKPRLKTTTYLFALGILCSISTLAVSDSNRSDSLIIDARAALRKKTPAPIAKALAEVSKQHPLYPYLEYWALRLRETPEDKAVANAFLQRHGNSFIADRYRSEWLRQMAASGDYSAFAKEAALVSSPDPELLCYLLTYRLNNKDGNALIEAEPLWLKQTGKNPACQPVIESLIWNQRVSASDVWARARRQVEDKAIGEVGRTLSYLPNPPDADEIDKALRQSERYLRQKNPQPQLAALALGVIAKTNPDQAASLLSTLSNQLPDDAEAWVYGQMAWAAALRRSEFGNRASDWYKRSLAAALGPDAAEWRVRALLMNGDWALVDRAIAALPKPLANEPAWRYWQGRAYSQLGRPAEARAKFDSLTGDLGFYSALAEEALGRLPTLPKGAAAASEADIDRLGASLEATRALALSRLDLRQDALNEWGWLSKKASDRELIALATWAERQNAYDLSIAAAAKTKLEHEPRLRFPMPHWTVAEPLIAAVNLDPAWVYGLMRQESRFVVSARSVVGATGLMQLMPATASFVARKIGLTPFHRGLMADIPTNIKIGTAYLRMALDHLGGSPVLATAAYNAGPGRAQRWRPSARAIEGAIYAENIPFTETRNYVKYVLANAVYYQTLMTGKGDSLLGRLGSISPITGGERAPAIP